MATRVPLTIRVNGLPVRSVTEYSAIGAYVIVLTTTTDSPRAAISVTSTYVAHEDTDTHATHLVMRRGAGPQMETRLHRRGGLAIGAEERRACLYEHLQQVLSALSAGRRHASIDVFEHAAEVLDA
jgi:hypothetical protein